MTTPPLWRRVVYALIPLVLLLGAVEIISLIVARSVLSTRSPTAGFDSEPLPKRAVEAGASELTVICVGDSWTFGWGLEVEESYPWLLEQALDQTRETTVVNLGNPGASPIRAARVLNTYLQRVPADVVVYLAGSNTPMNRVTIEDRRTPAPLRAVRPYLRYLATYRLLSQLIARARLRDDDNLKTWDVSEEMERIQPEHQGQWLEVALSSTRANMARMADLSEAFGFELLVLTYGLPLSLEPHRGKGWYRFPDLNAVIKQAAEENGLSVLDMEAAYAAHGVVGPEVLYFGDTRLSQHDLDIHPNAAGYRIYAEEVAGWIESRL